MAEQKGKAVALFLGIFLILLSGRVVAQEPQDPFTAEALKLRTALHYDSSLGAPLDSLVKLYAKENREEELVGLYQAHIAQYPEDAGAKAVLARILTTLERVEVDEFIQSAAQQHPTFPHLQYLLSENLKKKDNERSLEALSKAIDLETGKTRKSQWLGELLDRSKTEKGRELATAQLKKLLLVEGQTGPTMLSFGQVMLRHQFWELSLEALNKAIALTLNPEQKVEANVLAAKAETALGKTAEAGKRLDGILAKLAPDHHRRNEVMSLRISVIASDEDRLALLDKNRKAYESTPEKETAILDYAEILIAGGNTDEALKILKKGSIDLPESDQIEKLALQLLEKRTNRQDLIDYLGSRLEVHPGRTDLRYKLVKAHYQKDDPLAAEQDFNLVLASLEGKAKSDRILDLARFLRSVEKEKQAVKHYEAFLKLEPARLDVTRELCEIYLEDGLEEQVKKILAGTSAKGVEMENLLDLSQFLVDENFFGPSEAILQDFISTSSALPFEPGLSLARVRSELGNREEATSLLDELRKQTDTPARYKSWLNIGLLISDNFGSVDSFFDSEQARFNFSDDEWTIERIEKFLYLCEAGERRQLTSRVSAAIKNRLQSESIDTAMRIKLRQLLVRTLEKDALKAAEVEDQLKALAKEDPERINEYDLQRALLYHNVQRPDLATAILEKLNLEKVESASLLRDSYRMLIEFGDRKLAGAALAAVTRLEPADLFSWERRLSLLAAERNESEFRAAIRSLLQGIAQRGKAAEWREDTKRSLYWHLLDSYWRSIAEIVANESRYAEVLPLLEAVEREAQGHDLLWLNWARAWIFDRLGRTAERDNAVKQLALRLDTDPATLLSFPDGLTIPLASALAALDGTNKSRNSDAPKPKLPLLGLPKIDWGFEIEPGAGILQMEPSGKDLMVLDDRGNVYRVDSNSGKLLWKKNLGIPRLPTSKTAEAASVDAPISAGKVRQMITAGDRFLLSSGSELLAYDCKDAALLWKASLPPSGGNTETNSIPDIQFTGENGTIVVFEPRTDILIGIDAATGKLLWENTISSSEKPNSNLVSMNTGISVKNGRILVFGSNSAIYDLSTGDKLWSFSGEEVRVFPITLREQREDLSEEELVTLEQNKPRPVWAPIAPGSRRYNMSYLSPEPEDGEIMSFLDYPGSLLAPAVDWAKHRQVTGENAHAHLADDFLWLMDSRGLRLVSINLPLASRQFEVAGTFLGEESQHAWVLNQTDLFHADGSTGSVRSYSVANLGGNITGTVVAGRVYIRGSGGVAVYNAISGKRISGANWDPGMITYLSDLPLSPPLKFSWQGIVKRTAPGYPAYCYPMCDLVAEGKYFSVFGGNRIVAVSDQTPR
ncbi:MAG: PQQ-binding-like beta-propeller repeat protein [Verrucomicrobiales bacterium]|nr:PQQ-binding-like beta-propeller repeat protein [Verrucomicrobiales bacterium]